jgi:hypothetical protein
VNGEHQSASTRTSAPLAICGATLDELGIGFVAFKARRNKRPAKGPSAVREPD